VISAHSRHSRAYNPMQMGAPNFPGSDNSHWMLELGGADILVCPNPRVRAFLSAERIRVGSGGQKCPPLTNSMAGKNACPTIQSSLARNSGPHPMRIVVRGCVALYFGGFLVGQTFIYSFIHSFLSVRVREFGAFLPHRANSNGSDGQECPSLTIRSRQERMSAPPTQIRQEKEELHRGAEYN